MVSMKNQLAMVKHELKGAAGTRWKLESKTLREQVADLKAQASKDKLAIERKCVCARAYTTDKAWSTRIQKPEL